MHGTARSPWKVWVWLVGSALGAPAWGDKVVWFDFSATDFTADERQAILARVHAKFEFEWFETQVGDNLRFVQADPGGGAQRVVFENTTPDGAYGEADLNTRVATVNVRRVTHGPGRNFFDTRARQINAVVDIAAHELGHIKGVHDHNCNVPAEETQWVGANGRRYARTRGNGTLIDGRPGLMAAGHKLIPAERAADQRTFSVAEQRRIAAFVRREKAGRPVAPVPDGRRPDTDVCFVRGTRFDPAAPDAQPEWTEPFPDSPDDSWVDVMAGFANNADWDFGFSTADGGFMPLVEAGSPEGSVAFPGGTIVNFAIRPTGAGFFDPALSLTDIGRLDMLSDPVPAARAVRPLQSADYYRHARLTFDPDATPSTPNIEVTLSFDLASPDYFDGLYPVPEPATAAILLLGGGLARRRMG